MQQRGKNDLLLSCFVNKCFDGYQRVYDHSWKAKQSMDLAKLNSPNHQKEKEHSKPLIFKTNEQKNYETGKHYFIKNLVLHFKQIRHNLKRCRKKRGCLIRLSESQLPQRLTKTSANSLQPIPLTFTFKMVNQQYLTKWGLRFEV